MHPFVTVTGIAAPLMRANIDTDAIIPSYEIKRVSKEGLADGLFAGWRYCRKDSPDGLRAPDPDFVLNSPPYDTASLLVAGRNFGCGSSREHAVWALKEWGIRCVIAPSFGSIFRLNCIKNGLLPVVLDEDTIRCIVERIQSDAASNPVTVDLERKIVSMADCAWTFEIADKDRYMLLNGLDEIAVTLQSETAITAFEAEVRRRRPWVFL